MVNVFNDIYLVLSNHPTCPPSDMSWDPGHFKQLDLVLVVHGLDSDGLKHFGKGMKVCVVMLAKKRRIGVENRPKIDQNIAILVQKRPLKSWKFKPTVINDCQRPLVGALSVAFVEDFGNTFD